MSALALSHRQLGLGAGGFGRRHGQCDGQSDGSRGSEYEAWHPHEILPIAVRLDEFEKRDIELSTRSNLITQAQDDVPEEMFLRRRGGRGVVSHTLAYTGSIATMRPPIKVEVSGCHELLR